MNDLLKLKRTPGAPEPLIGPSDLNQFIRDGWQMARREGEGVFASLELKRAAESKAAEAATAAEKLEARKLFESREAYHSSALKEGCDLARFARDYKTGRRDLLFAIILLSVSAALALFVLLGFAPIWLALPLALATLGMALAIEELLRAYNQERIFPESLFITLSLLALLALFLLGAVRGSLLGALSVQLDSGAASQVLQRSPRLLQSALGLLAIVVEVLSGFLLYRARKKLCSKGAVAMAAREQCDQKLIAIKATIEAQSAEPEIRYRYRLIGVRQFLACERGRRELTQAPPKRHHLKQAATGALIALLIIFAVLLLASHALAAPSGKTIVTLLDLSKSISAESFEANLRAAQDLFGKLGPGDRLIIIGITSSFGRPALIFDRTLPQKSGYLGLELQAARERLSLDWQKTSASLLRKARFGRTDILGALALLPYLNGLTAGETHLVVFSDLRQCTPELNLESEDRIVAVEEIARLKKEQLIPDLKGYRVYLLGVDPNGNTLRYFKELKAFWLAFFRAAGTEVKAYSIDRTPPSF